MKKLFRLLLCNIAVAVCAHASPPQYIWSAKLHVTNDNGQPVADASAHIYYLLTNEFVGLTDTNGNFTATHTDGSENLAFEVEKSGYYSFSMMYHMGRKYQEEKWNPKQDVILKKIIKTIPMYAKSVNLKVPEVNKPVGYDLMTGDWVAPYGKGNYSHIFFEGHFDHPSTSESNFTLTVSFPVAGDGIQEFAAPIYYLGDRGSALRSASQAPTNGYLSQLIQTDIWKNGRPFSSSRYLNKNYYLRLQTILDEKGNVKSAVYGKIYGDFMQFKYYLNPTPNDRDLEFNPKQNLIKKLESIDAVREP